MLRFTQIWSDLVRCGAPEDGPQAGGASRTKGAKGILHERGQLGRGTWATCCPAGLIQRFLFSWEEFGTVRAENLLSGTGFLLMRILDQELTTDNTNFTDERPRTTGLPWIWSRMP